jgi:hypothetical protein
MTSICPYHQVAESAEPAGSPPGVGPIELNVLALTIRYVIELADILL